VVKNDNGAGERVSGARTALTSDITPINPGFVPPARQGLTMVPHDGGRLHVLGHGRPGSTTRG
jgi:hypothetical protein